MNRQHLACLWRTYIWRFRHLGKSLRLLLFPLFSDQGEWFRYKKAKPENIRLTEDLYVSVGNEVGALVIPVGLAFEEAYRRRPDIKLHKDFAGRKELYLLCQDRQRDGDLPAAGG